MKKYFITMVALGLFTVSCGEKKEANAADVVTEQVSEEKELSYELAWTAFKTPAKVGVTGTFTDIKLNGVKAGEASLEKALESATFVVVTSSVDTKDAGRDETLKVGFFSKMVGNINGFFGTFADGKVLVNLTMNGITKEKEFEYTVTEEGLKLNGSIDIVEDFTAQAAFDSLHEACKVLHEGKTWSDVEISIDIKK